MIVLAYVCVCVCSSSRVGGGGGSGSASSSSCEPPVSSSDTAVWYWLLNGIATTVIYDKHTHEIWCNGYVLHPVSQSVMHSLIYTSYNALLSGH